MQIHQYEPIVCSKAKQCGLKHNEENASLHASPQHPHVPLRAILINLKTS